MTGLSHLGVSSLLSYVAAVLLPAFDALIPVLPSETAVIALGVATAGPRCSSRWRRAARSSVTTPPTCLAGASARPPAAGSLPGNAARAGGPGPSGHCTGSAPG